MPVSQLPILWHDLFKVSSLLGRWLTNPYRPPRRDVVQHRLHPSVVRLKTSQSLQVECCSLQARISAIDLVEADVLVELGVADPIPALLLRQSRTSYSRVSGVVRRLVPTVSVPRDPKYLRGNEGHAVLGSGSGHLHNPMLPTLLSRPSLIF